jgi:hypothetical protein
MILLLLLNLSENYSYLISDPPFFEMTLKENNVSLRVVYSYTL